MIEDILSLSKALEKRSSLTPSRIFIRFEGRRFTYCDINNMADFCASFLRSKGVGKHDRIAILSHNCPFYIGAYLGILKAGGIVVPINTLLSPPEIDFILEDSGASICFYDKALEHIIGKLERNRQGQFFPIHEIDPRVYQPDSSPHELNVDPDELAAILYTSGTTGHPKGAMLTHRNILTDAIAAASAFSASQTDRFIVFLPLSHSFTFTVCVVIPMLLGASITVLPSIRPFSKIIKRLILDRISIFIAVPVIYNLLAKKKIPFIFKLLLRVRFCVSGAAPLPLKTLRDFELSFKVPLLEGYGLTEASPVVSVNHFAQSKRKAGTVGLPLPGIEVMVIDDEGNPLPPGTPGELIVRGPNVMKGYFNRPEETAVTIKNGWLRTGDVAVIDPDGFIKIVDRKKDMIIVDGLNIYPAEVEEAAHKHPAVEDCAMVGMPLEEGKELPVMFIVKKKDLPLNEKQFKLFLSQHIASYKLPKKTVFIDELPRTPTGKVLKKELRKWKGI